MNARYERLIRMADRIIDTHSGMAGPFLGYAPNTYLKGKGILYVGKATNRDFGIETFLSARSATMPMRIEERMAKARGVFENWRQTPFWYFAERISKVVDPQAENLSNLAWSNLVKIGKQTENPDFALESEESNLYIEMLKSEIAEWCPAIIVFVSNQYAENLLLRAIGNPNSDDWNKSEDEMPKEVEDVWWLEKTDTRPSVLWMRHPQGATNRCLDYALRVVKRLVYR